MRITFVTPYASLAGGIRVVASYARALEALGHVVTVVSRPEQRPVSLKKRVRIALGRDKPFRVRPQTPLLEFLGERHVVSASFDRILPEEVPDGDAVIATWWETAPWVADLPASKGRKFYLLQDYEVFDGRRRDAVAATYALEMQKIAVSSYIRDEIVANHAPRGEILVLPNAVDTGRFTVPPRARNDRLTVGLVYTPAPRKNVPLALTALERARAQHPDLQAIAFGRALVRPDMPLPDWITYHCAPPQDRIPQIYADCDLWLFPTEREGFGLPLLEAMACRTPVLATDAGAAPDLIDGTNGLILPRDPEAFASAILRFADMPAEDWKGWSEAARGTALKNTWDAAARRLLAVLEGTADA